jgi:hypothetical protein
MREGRYFQGKILLQYLGLAQLFTLKGGEGNSRAVLCKQQSLGSNVGRPNFLSIVKFGDVELACFPDRENITKS